MFSTEMRITKEFGNYHYGWFCLFSFDFGDYRNPGKKSSHIDYAEFENIFISSQEMDEIRNQINYMLEEEDEENETVIDPADEIDIGDPVDTDDL